ncbi:MAG: hypothetical protein L3K07_05800 [Thermoplasmata archaeon]|nr:hypothetical protein [Thermoplasmata archaeon]
MGESGPAERGKTAPRPTASRAPDSPSSVDHVEVELERTYESEREAEELRSALEADRPDYLVTSRRGATLRFAVSATSAASARSTLDDLLAALAAAERVRGIGARGSTLTGPRES